MIDFFFAREKLLSSLFTLIRFKQKLQNQQFESIKSLNTKSDQIQGVIRSSAVVSACFFCCQLGIIIMPDLNPKNWHPSSPSAAGNRFRTSESARAPTNRHRPGDPCNKQLVNRLYLVEQRVRIYEIVSVLLTMKFDELSVCTRFFSIVPSTNAQ